MPLSRQNASAVARVRVWAATNAMSRLLPWTELTSERPQRPRPRIAARIMDFCFWFLMVVALEGTRLFCPFGNGRKGLDVLPAAGLLERPPCPLARRAHRISNSAHSARF